MKEQMEQQRADERLEQLERRLETVYAWAGEQVATHQPTVTGAIDVSIRSTDDLASRVGEYVENNVFCSECRTRWPCNDAKNVRMLREVLDGHLTPYQVHEMFKRSKVREGQVRFDVRF